MNNKHNFIPGLHLLRVMGALGLLAMHIQVNTSYEIGDWFYRTVIFSCNHFVSLFMMLSGFGIFYGYYDAFREGHGDLQGFYRRRFLRIWPFFAWMLLLQVVLQPSWPHLTEGLMQLTLSFGLLPNNQLEVAGVGWMVGLIFLFYMLFPYVVFLMWNQKRAWVSVGISIVAAMMCSAYFARPPFVTDSFVVRRSFLYSAPYFLTGGLLYLFLPQITGFWNRRKPLLAGMLIAGIAAWFWLPQRLGVLDVLLLKNLGLFALMIIGGICFSNEGVQKTPPREITLELYLSQMLIFRGLERAHLLYLFGRGWLSYLFVFGLTLLLVVCFVRVTCGVFHLVCRCFWIKSDTGKKKSA